jgi:sugar lactone lactonase YvrE
VEVASNDDLYVTDFGSAFVMRVNANDPTDTELLASDMPQANGIAISPDENTLYFVLSFEKRVIAMDRLPDGSWDAPRSFHETPSTSSFQGLEVDGCGNVYWSDLKMGGTTEIWRKTPDGVHAEVLVTLPTPYVPNLHFGSGVGGWERDWLYVADRDDGTLYMIEVGIPGKKQVGLP